MKLEPPTSYQTLKINLRILGLDIKTKITKLLEENIVTLGRKKIS